MNPRGKSTLKMTTFLFSPKKGGNTFAQTLTEAEEASM